MNKNKIEPNHVEGSSTIFKGFPGCLIIFFPANGTEIPRVLVEGII